MKAGNSTRASTKVIGTPSSKAPTASQVAEVRTPFKVTPLRLKPADPTNCITSDNMADCCKTLCKVCGKAFSLVNMRNHTLSAHKLQITKYKEEYGPFELLQEVWHACHLCGELVLLDNDHLGGHIKSVHKMKEKAYKDQYIVSNTKAVQQSLTENALVKHEPRKNVSNRDLLKKIVSKKDLLQKNVLKKDLLKKVSSKKDVSKEMLSKRKVVKEIDQKKVKVKKVGLKKKELKTPESKSVNTKKCEPVKVALKTPSGHVCQEPGCGKAFEWKSNLERHIQTVHRGEKPFTCQEEGCGKAFGTGSNLKRHQNVHAMEKKLQALKEKCLPNTCTEEKEAVKPPACRACEGCRKKKRCEVIARRKNKKLSASKASEVALSSQVPLKSKFHKESEALQVVKKNKLVAAVAFKGSGGGRSGKKSKLMEEVRQEEVKGINRDNLSRSKGKGQNSLARRMKEQEVATVEQSCKEKLEGGSDVNRIKLTRSNGPKGLAWHLKEQEIATEDEGQDEDGDAYRINMSSAKGQGGITKQVQEQLEVATAVEEEGSNKKRKVEENLAPDGENLHKSRDYEKVDDGEVSFLGLKRRQVGMPMAVTVGEVLHQRENPLPFAWRCHLDEAQPPGKRHLEGAGEREVGVSGRQEENLVSHMKGQGAARVFENESNKKKKKGGSDVNRIQLDKVEQSEAGVSGKQQENILGLERSVRQKSVPLKFKSSTIECEPKKRKKVSNKFEDDKPEENKETGMGFDPFVDVFYDCAVPDCQDCKELELL